MATPVWTTTAGKLASIDEQASYSLQLEANDAVDLGDSTAITYSLIAGSLPSGMELTSTGLLTGIPAEVSKRTRYTFVVRATAGTQITDRTFYLDVDVETSISRREYIEDDRIEKKGVQYLNKVREGIL